MPAGSMIGLLATSKRTYASLPRLPLLAPHLGSRQQLTHGSTGDPQTLTGRSGSVSRGGHCTFPWVLVPTGFVCALPESLVGMRFDFNVSAPLLLSCFGFSFVLGRGASFFGGFPHPPVDGCSAASCAFGVLAGDGECTPFYSTILYVWG